MEVVVKNLASFRVKSSDSAPYQKGQNSWRVFAVKRRQEPLGIEKKPWPCLGLYLVIMDIGSKHNNGFNFRGTN